jgi:hypothetical protein
MIWVLSDPEKFLEKSPNPLVSQKPEVQVASKATGVELPF